MKNLEVRIKNEELKAVRCVAQFSILNSQFLICNVICALMTCAVTFAAEGQLQFRFQPDDRFSLESVTEQKTARVVDGNEHVVEQTVRLVCDLDIEEVEDNGCAWAKYTYKHVAMKTQGTSGDFEFDSDPNAVQPPASPAKRGEPAKDEADRGIPTLKVPLQALPMALTLGESFYIKITPQGRIDKINGLQSIANAARGKLPNIQGKEQVIGAIERRLDESFVKRELEEQLAVFPDACDACDGIAVGDTWSRSVQAGHAPDGAAAGDANLVIEKTSRLRSRSNSTAIIDVNIIIRRPDGNAPEITVGNFKARREISGQGTGQIEVNEAAGRASDGATAGRIISSKKTQNSIERIKFLASGPRLRLPPDPEPTRMHAVMTFQMTRRAPAVLLRKNEAAGTSGNSSEPNRP